jgi:hypothetical protein
MKTKAVVRRATRAAATLAATLAMMAAMMAAMVAAGCGDDMPAGPPVDQACTPASGNICSLAGTGIPGDGDDALPALKTRLYLPQDTAVGPDGRLYVIDWNNHRIRVINPDG